jgi:hypothetical protein
MFQSPLDFQIRDLNWTFFYLSLVHHLTSQLQVGQDYLGFFSMKLLLNFSLFEDESISSMAIEFDFKNMTNSDFYLNP